MALSRGFIYELYLIIKVKKSKETSLIIMQIYKITKSSNIHIFLAKNTLFWLVIFVILTMQKYILNGLVSKTIYIAWFFQFG